MPAKEKDAWFTPAGFAKIMPLPSSLKLGKRKKRDDAGNMSSLVASSSNSSNPEAAVSRKRLRDVDPRPKPGRHPPPPQTSDNAVSAMLKELLDGQAQLRALVANQVQELTKKFEKTCLELASVQNRVSTLEKKMKYCDRTLSRSVAETAHLKECTESDIAKIRDEISKLKTTHPSKDPNANANGQGDTAKYIKREEVIEVRKGQHLSAQVPNPLPRQADLHRS